MITEEQILKALSGVIEPDLHKDLVSLNMIHDLQIKDNTVSFKIMLTTPACPLKEKMENDCRAAIAAIAPDMEVKVEMEANVTSNRSDKLVLPGVKNIVAVVSGKGGVGKSTVASNLALALAASGAKVGLLDADIHGPSMPIMFGIDETPEMREVDGKSILKPIERHGIKIMSIGFMINPDQAVVWRGPIISSALRQFVSETEWGELDYLVLDMPPGTGDIHLTMLQIVPLTGAVIVTTPQEVALTDAIKAASMFDMMPTKVPVLGVVENMSWFTPAELPGSRYKIFGEGGGQKLADKFHIDLLGQVPLIMSIRDGGDKGMPAVLDETNEAYGVFMEIAGKVAQRLSVIHANQVQASN
jgi:ATP-binding protein involved in chromosome partitioning